MSFLIGVEFCLTVFFKLLIKMNFYHEPLAHVPACMNGPKRALVIGGGDGGAIEEILKYPCLEEVVTELDRDVVDASKMHLPEISKGAFENPKTTLLIEDGIAYIKNCKEKFDLYLDLRPVWSVGISLY